MDNHEQSTWTPPWRDSLASPGESTVKLYVQNSLNFVKLLKLHTSSKLMNSQSRQSTQLLHKIHWYLKKSLRLTISQVYEWYTSYLTWTSTHIVHITFELPASHPIIRARTQKLIMITTNVSPQPPKRSMTFAVARITVYLKDASYADNKSHPWIDICRKSIIALYIQCNLLDLNLCNRPIGCSTQLDWPFRKGHSWWL